MAKHWKKPESKQCKKCSAIFSRVGNTTDKHWDMTLNCPRCRAKKNNKRDNYEQLGHYEVKNKAIDDFLYKFTTG